MNGEQENDGQRITRMRILMSHTNPSGWRLEDLLRVMREDLDVKNHAIANDPRVIAKGVLANNRQIMGLLMQAEALQRLSLDMLAELGADEGPLGRPRIGGKSA